MTWPNLRLIVDKSIESAIMRLPLLKSLLVECHPVLRLEGTRRVCLVRHRMDQDPGFFWQVVEGTVLGETKRVAEFRLLILHIFEIQLKL